MSRKLCGVLYFKKLLHCRQVATRGKQLIGAGQGALDKPKRRDVCMVLVCFIAFNSSSKETKRSALQIGSSMVRDTPGLGGGLQWSTEKKCPQIEEGGKEYNNSHIHRCSKE